MSHKEHTRILIVGGGFAGIEAALRLSKKHFRNTSITLLSKNTHFEYYPMLYRAVAGKSPLEVCIQLSDIFEDTNVYVVHDEVVSFIFDQKVVAGVSGSRYHYDYLVLALGSESAYFGIPGLEQHAFPFKSINDALRLKNHLHQVFHDHSLARKEDLESNLRVTIVGGGPAGVELAGELSSYVDKLCTLHEVAREHVNLLLIEGADRLVPMMSEAVSAKIEERLKFLGVHVHTGEKMLRADMGGIYTDHMHIPSHSVVWTAGVKASHYYMNAQGLKKAPSGRVEVTDELEAVGQKNVFIIGDGAQTQYAGLAQTAIDNGKFVAKVIASRIRYSTKKFSYVPKKVAYAMPVGPDWAMIVVGKHSFSGLVGWWMRTLIDLRYFMSILPLRKAWRAWKEGEKNCESCITCASGILEEK
jgi:NADH dehydrogenase